ALLPAEGAERDRALEHEAFFGKKAGRAVRQWMYGKLVEAGGGLAMAVMLAAYPPSVRFFGKVGAPLLEKGLTRAYRLQPEGVARAHATLLEVFDRLDRAIDGDPTRYLAGGALSIADIAAASLLGPLVGPPGSPWGETSVDAPESIRSLREE